MFNKFSSLRLTLLLRPRLQDYSLCARSVKMVGEHWSIETLVTTTKGIHKQHFRRCVFVYGLEHAMALIRL